MNLTLTNIINCFKTKLPKFRKTNRCEVYNYILSQSPSLGFHDIKRPISKYQFAIKKEREREREKREAVAASQYLHDILTIGHDSLPITTLIILHSSYLEFI